MELWVDIINPSHVLFFNSLLNEFSSDNLFVTIRDRAETLGLVKSFGMEGIVVGRDYQNELKKSLSILWRTMRLFPIVKKFDYSISFENGMSVIVSKFKRKESILLCDNDLKFYQTHNSFQKIETKVKSMADFIIVPKACYDFFNKYIEGNIITYDGFKEDIYIADYTPNQNFSDEIPFDHFVVLRPESLESFYVVEKKSLLPDLLNIFNREGINVVFLPREKTDINYSKNFDVFIPKRPLNGLDLCYYADVVLTGSGTMAREAACLGKPAVSFFPGDKLLSVDKQLIHENKMFHSRDSKEIFNYVFSKIDKNEKTLDLQRSKMVKKEVVNIIKRIIHEK